MGPHRRDYITFIPTPRQVIVKSCSSFSIPRQHNIPASTYTMAGITHNTGIQLLRNITFYSFHLSFLLFPIHGFATRTFFPALGITAISASNIHASAVQRRKSAPISLGSPVRGLTSRNIFWTDLLLVLLYAVLLVASWISLGDYGAYRRYREPAYVILGWTCVGFLLVNWYVPNVIYKLRCIKLIANYSVIHVYFCVTYIAHEQHHDYKLSIRSDTDHQVTDETRQVRQGTMQS